MKSLVVEDEFVSRKLMQLYLSRYGETHVAVDGEEAVDAFRQAMEKGEPYDLICLDIMMPGVNGHEALERIRALEKDAGVEPSRECKVVMTTALGDPKNVVKAYYKGGATAYLVKPVSEEDIDRTLNELKLTGRDDD